MQQEFENRSGANDGCCIVASGCIISSTMVNQKNFNAHTFQRKGSTHSRCCLQIRQAFAIDYLFHILGTLKTHTQMPDLNSPNSGFHQAQGSISSFSISRSRFQSLTSAGCAADNLRTCQRRYAPESAHENCSLTRKGTKKHPKYRGHQMFYQRRLRFKPDFCALKKRVDWIKSETWCFFGQKWLQLLGSCRREGQLGGSLW